MSEHPDAQKNINYFISLSEGPFGLRIIEKIRLQQMKERGLSSVDLVPPIFAIVGHGRRRDGTYEGLTHVMVSWVKKGKNYGCPIPFHQSERDFKEQVARFFKVKD